MKKKIHINQHVIRRNGKTGEREPCITVKTYKSNEYHHQVLISELIEVLGALQAPSTQRDLVELWNAYVDVTSAMEGGNK